MNEYTNCASFLESKNNSDIIEPLFTVSRDGLLDMRKLKHFLTHSRSSLLRRCVMTLGKLRTQSRSSTFDLIPGTLLTFLVSCLFDCLRTKQKCAGMNKPKLF